MNQEYWRRWKKKRLV